MQLLMMRWGMQCSIGIFRRVQFSCNAVAAQRSAVQHSGLADVSDAFAM